jgi:hypothetical protein
MASHDMVHDALPENGHFWCVTRGPVKLIMPSIHIKVIATNNTFPARSLEEGRGTSIASRVLLGSLLSAIPLGC